MTNNTEPGTKVHIDGIPWVVLSVTESGKFNCKYAYSDFIREFDEQDFDGPNKLTRDEEDELRELAFSEAEASGELFTICQSCTWPILYGEKCYHSSAAEGHICQECTNRYNRIV